MTNSTIVVSFASVLGSAATASFGNPGCLNESIEMCEGPIKYFMVTQYRQYVPRVISNYSEGGLLSSIGRSVSDKTGNASTIDVHVQEYPIVLPTEVMLSQNGKRIAISFPTKTPRPRYIFSILRKYYIA